MLSSKSVALTTCIDFAIAVFSAITFVICWVWNTTVGKPPKPRSIIFSTAQISRVKGSPICKVFLKRSLISYLWTRTQLLLYGDRNVPGNINNFFSKFYHWLHTINKMVWFCNFHQPLGSGQLVGLSTYDF